MRRIYSISTVGELPKFAANFHQFCGISWENQGGDLTPPGKIQKVNYFGFLGFRLKPSNWPSFMEIGEMACATPAWWSGGCILKLCFV